MKLLFDIVELSTCETSPPMPRSPAITPSAWTLLIRELLFACFANVPACSFAEIFASFIDKSWTAALLKVSNNGFFKL